MDKFKNLFTDEEIIEEEELDPIEIKEIKKEEEVHQLPTFMREKIEKEERVKEKSFTFKEEDSKEELKVETITLSTPVSMDEELPSIKKVDEKKSFKFPIDIFNHILNRSFITISFQLLYNTFRSFDSRLNMFNRIILMYMLEFAI